MGIKLNATNNEAKRLKAIVQARSLKSCPAIPPTNKIGKNTAIVVKVEAVTAVETCSAPARAASATVNPVSRILKIFSRTTMELSTSIPIPKARPPRLIRFKLIPLKCIKMNVATIDIGIEKLIMTVFGRCLRKMKITRIARIDPRIAVERTSCSAARINVDWSPII